MADTPSKLTKASQFVKRHIVMVVMVPMLIGVHLGWMAIQNNDLFVKKHERRELPLIEGANYLEKRIAAVAESYNRTGTSETK